MRAGSHAAVYTHMRSQRWLIVLGIALIGIALALPIRGELENDRAKRASESILAELNEERPQLREASASDAYTESSADMPVVQVGAYDYVGSVVVTSLGLELPVAATLDEQCLCDCPCVYAGSYLTNDLVVCGEGYPSHFGNLESVGIGKEVLLVAADGVVHRYVVSNVEIDNLEGISAFVDDWDLTLFTLKSSDTYLVVRCVASQF